VTDASSLLATLVARGVSVTTAGGRLRLDSPAGRLSAADLAELSAHKAELLALVERHDHAQAEALALIDQAEPRHRNVPGRAGVLTIAREALHAWRAEGNPELLTAPDQVRNLLARWEEHPPTPARRGR
jgi:hypothetical protein